MFCRAQSFHSKENYQENSVAMRKQTKWKKSIRLELHCRMRQGSEVA